MESETFEDMGEKEFSNSGHVNVFRARDDDYPLCKAVVDHNHNGVHSAYFREISNKVYGELLKRKGCRRCDGVQWRANWVCVHLVLLAYGTSFDELVDIGSQARPPEISFQEGFGVESTCVPECRRGMEGGYKGLVGIWWDVHLSFVVEMTPFVCPVFHGGPRE